MHQTVTQYKILVRDLILPSRIGCYPHERHASQKVRFQISATLVSGAQPATLEETLCYHALIDHIKHLSQTHIDLVEDYAHLIATWCLQHDCVASVEVTVEKLEAIAEAGSVGASVSMLRAAL